MLYVLPQFSAINDGLTQSLSRASDSVSETKTVNSVPIEPRWTLANNGGNAGLYDGIVHIQPNITLVTNERCSLLPAR